MNDFQNKGQLFVETYPGVCSKHTVRFLHNITFRFKYNFHITSVTNNLQDINIAFLKIWIESPRKIKIIK